MGSRRRLLVAAAVLMTIAPTATVTAGRPPTDHTPVLLTSGLAGGSGSTVGPDRALYVTEPVAGEISRVDPSTGEVTLFASGLPTQNPAIGAFALANPPSTDFFVPTGVQYAMQPYRGGFLVTDGHHNRVLRVTVDGEVSELIAFDNIVPTGLDTRFGRVFMSEAGPVPHLPEDGRIVAFRPRRPPPVEVAAGGRPS